MWEWERHSNEKKMSFSLIWQLIDFNLSENNLVERTTQRFILFLFLGGSYDKYEFLEHIYGINPWVGYVCFCECVSHEKKMEFRSHTPKNVFYFQICQKKKKLGTHLFMWKASSIFFTLVYLYSKKYTLLSSC